MVIILYDLERLELVYSIASIIMRHYNQDIKIMPASPSTIESIVKEEIKDYQYNYYFDEEAEIDPSFTGNEDLKIFILGLGPKKYKENNDIYNLVENYGENITLWIDNQTWPSNLLKYFAKKEINFFLDQSLSCLEILATFKYYAPQALISAEKAIMKQDYYKNKNSARYLKAFEVASIKGIMHNEKLDAQNDIMNNICSEIISKEDYGSDDDPRISMLADKYFSMKIKTKKMIEKIRDKHPAFSIAKSYGGKVGILQMGIISDLIDIEEIKSVISTKYPELWIISYKFENKNYIQADSCISSLFSDIKSFLTDVKDINIKEFLYIIGNRYYHYLKNEKKFATLDKRVPKREHIKTTRP